MEILTEVLSPMVPLVIKHIAYPFTTSSNIEALELATRKLAALKEDTKTEIENERGNTAPTKQAEQWFNQVDTIEKEAEDILTKYRQQCRCIWGISPNLWSSYKISRSAAKKLIEVKSLCDEKANLEVIVQMPPPLVQEMPVASSKSPNLELALQYIKDDAHSIIGIWGMGGVGKTHLLKQINNELSKDGAFNVVVFVTCSKECSEEKVQNEIIDNLGLQKNDSTKQKQSTIYNFLSQKSFVLLFDDLWNRVDLDTIGIPNLSGKKKVALTTRSTEVCGQMEAHKKIKVDVLKEDDAWFLFKEKATEETINSDPIIQKYAVEVVKELGRLPLALITIGRAMHDKMGPSEWEEALDLLRKARMYDVEFSGSNMSVFHVLKFSYDSLKNDTLKQCFLHCSLWPEDQLIEKRDLVELWMGLGLIDKPETEIHMAYNTGYNYIRRLEAVCLLEEAGDEDDMIKMHDVIRDMALWIARNQGKDEHKWIVQTCTTSKCQVTIPQETEKLSLMHCRTNELSISVSCPSTKLSTLLLRGNTLRGVKTLGLENFCELTVLDLSKNDLRTLPIEVCELVKLQFLNLSLNTYMIKNTLPKEFEALINLKYLLLRGMWCTVPKGVLSKLKALRVLDSIYYKLDGRPEVGLEILSSLEDELQCLPELQALGIVIDWGIGTKAYKSITSYFLGKPQLQSKLTYLDIREWNTRLMKFERASDDDRICCLGRLERLGFKSMSYMQEIVWKGLNPKDVFPRLQVLIFQFCWSLRSISWVVGLPCIREFTVIYCPEVKQLICIGELKDDDANAIMASQPSFPSLKKLILHNNLKLESISDTMITFPALSFLDVYRCNKLKKLPFNTGNPPKRLNLEGTEEWWNNLEMEDSSHRSLLRPYFKSSHRSLLRPYFKSSHRSLIRPYFKKWEW